MPPAGGGQSRSQPGPLISWDTRLRLLDSTSFRTGYVRLHAHPVYRARRQAGAYDFDQTWPRCVSCSPLGNMLSRFGTCSGRPPPRGVRRRAREPLGARARAGGWKTPVGGQRGARHRGGRQRWWHRPPPRARVSLSRPLLSSAACPPPAARRASGRCGAARWGRSRTRARGGCQAAGGRGNRPCLLPRRGDCGTPH